MNNQKTIFAIMAIVAALSFVALAPSLIAINAKAFPFSSTGNPHREHGPGSSGNPHHPPTDTGNPHFCPSPHFCKKVIR